MGYTHYFEQHKPASREQWDRIADDFAYLYYFGHLPEIQFESDFDARPEITGETIRFNGVGNDGYETMLLSRYGQGFQCCKTAHRPYDLAITALLTVAHYHAPGVWEISSDGDREDWQEALELVTEYVQPLAVIPPRV